MKGVDAAPPRALDGGTRDFDAAHLPARPPRRIEQIAEAEADVEQAAGLSR